MSASVVAPSCVQSTTSVFGITLSVTLHLMRIPLVYLLSFSVLGVPVFKTTTCFDFSPLRRKYCSKFSVFAKSGVMIRRLASAMLLFFSVSVSVLDTMRVALL